MKDYIVFIQDLLSGRNEEFDNADKKRIRLITPFMPILP